MRKLFITLSIILFAQTLMAQSKVDSIATYIIRKDGISTDSIYSSKNETIETRNATSITIDTSKYPINFQDYTLYKVNWRKVKTLADMKLILEAFNFSVTGNSAAYKKIKKYLIEVK